METRIYLSSLYDIYGELLTKKQQQYFEEYYFDNLSLSELSENYEVTRTAIHNQVKEAEEKLKRYENILKVYEKNEKLIEIIKPLNQDIQNKIKEII